MAPPTPSEPAPQPRPQPSPVLPYWLRLLGSAQPPGPVQPRRSARWLTITVPGPEGLLLQAAHPVTAPAPAVSGRVTQQAQLLRPPLPEGRTAQRHPHQGSRSCCRGCWPGLSAPAFQPQAPEPWPAHSCKLHLAPGPPKTLRTPPPGAQWHEPLLEAPGSRLQQLQRRDLTGPALRAPGTLRSSSASGSSDPGPQTTEELRDHAWRGSPRSPYPILCAHSATTCMSGTADPSCDCNKTKIWEPPVK